MTIHAPTPQAESARRPAVPAGFDPEAIRAEIARLTDDPCEQMRLYRKAREAVAAPAKEAAAAAARPAGNPDAQVRRKRAAKPAPAPDPHRAAYLKAIGETECPAPTDFKGDDRQPIGYVPDLFPRAIDDFAVDIAGQVGTRPTPIALSCLIAASAAVRADWRLKAGPSSWTVPPVLWGIIAGDSGAGKSPTMKPATKPLDAIEAQWHRADKRARDDWKRADDAHRASVARAMKEGAATPARPHDLAEECPPNRALTTNDATPEALVAICAENPAGIAYIEDESTKGAGGFDRYSGGASGEEQMFNKAWDADSYRKNRVGGGMLYASTFAVSLLLGSQDEKLAQAMKGNRSGYLARFLIATATRPAEPPKRRAPNKAAADTWKRTLEALAAGDIGQTIELDNEADEELTAFQVGFWATVVDKTKPASWREHVSKWDGIWLRLCLIYHLIENADQVAIGGMVPPVGLDLARRVSRTMREIFEPEAARFHLDLLNKAPTPKGGLAPAAIADFIERAGAAEITIRALRQGTYAFRNAEEAALAAALNELVGHGWLSPRQKRGRTWAWIVNPAALAAGPAPEATQEAVPAAATETAPRAPAPASEDSSAGSTLAAFQAEIGPSSTLDDDPSARPFIPDLDTRRRAMRAAPDLIDPQPIDPDEEAARWAAYEAMGRAAL